MPERLHPGVYVEEVKPAVLAIEGVSTSTAAFIGVAERGPVRRATFLTSFAEYRRTFGDWRHDSFLTYSVQNFFDNGGKKCYVVRVVGAGAQTADIVLKDREHVELGADAAQQILFDTLSSVVAEPSLTIQASSPGVWGNLLDVIVGDGTRDPSNEFKLVVKFRDEIVETFDNLSMSLGDENFAESVIGGGQSQFITARRQTTASGDTPAALVSGVLDSDARRIDNVTDTPVLAIRLSDVTVNKIVLTKSNKNTAERVAAEIQAEVRAAVPAGAAAEVARAFQEFQCTFVATPSPRYVLVSGSDAAPRTIAVPAATLGANETDVRARLKLDVAGADANQAFVLAGRPLQRGASRSGNEPQTSTNGSRNLRFNLNRDGFQTVSLDSGLSGGDTVAANIEAKVRGIQGQRRDPANQSAYAEFTAAYDARYELTFGDVPAGAGEFTFAASASATDLSGTAQLRLRGANETYAGSATGPLVLTPGLPARQRTIVSGSVVNTRPKTDVSGIADGKLRLQITPPAAAALNVDLDFSAVAGTMTTGEATAAAIQAAVRAQAAAAAAANPNMRAALANFEARYVAHYTLTSGAVRLTDAAGNEAGPISSVEVLPSPSGDAAPMLKLGLVNGGVEQNGAALLRPVPGEYDLGDHLVDPAVPGPVHKATAGTDGSAPQDTDYVGDAAAGSGLHALDPVSDVSLVAVPGIGSKQVVGAGFGYCANRPLLDCFFVADLGGPPTGDQLARTDVPLITTAAAARDWVRGLPTKNDFGAIYFPWLEAPDPIGKGKNPRRTLPPSGFVTGMYARIDSRRGVFKAPAGTETNLTGALGLAAHISDSAQDILNPNGINVIRAFPAAGTVIWGSRTLSSDSAWRYVPVRRMAIFLRVSIYNGIQFAVFEPNDDDLWASLRLTIGAFMLLQFRAGAFQGDAPDKAFFVKCDATTTTQADIDSGVVNILVGFAPLKPAEFVVLKLSQKAGQSPS